MRGVIYEIVDRDANGNPPDFLEILPYFAPPNAVVGFGRMNGQTVGIVANNPIHLAGVLDIDSSDKIARFVRTCDAYNIPIVTLVDVPGYLPGPSRSTGGNHKARRQGPLRLLRGDGSDGHRHPEEGLRWGGIPGDGGEQAPRADFVFAWPTAEIAVMGGPEGAANIIFRKEIAAAENPEEVRQQKIAEYRERFANPYVAASRGYIDDVIDRPRRGAG